MDAAVPLGAGAQITFETVQSGELFVSRLPDGRLEMDFPAQAAEEAALDAANLRARIIACGMISQYNLAREETPGVRNITHINRKRIRMQGIGIGDHDHRQAEFLEEMSGWLASGQVTYRVDVCDGLENAPAAFVAMLKGENFGKQVVKVGSDF